MAKDKPSKIVSKKHLARLERERRQTNVITSVAIGIMVVIIGLIVYGIFGVPLMTARQPVVTVNGESVTMREFQVRVRVTRQQYINQYMQYYQFAQMFGIDPSTDPSLSQTFSQIQTELATPSTIGQQVIEDITNDLIIRQYARSNGIVVQDSEMEKAIQEAFGYFPDGTLTPTLTSTPFSYSTLSALQDSLMTPTGTATLIPSATLAPTITLGPTPTTTSIPSLTPTRTITAIPSITPTATPYTLEGFQTQYKNGVVSYSNLGMTEADFRKIYFESRLYRQRVTDIITGNVAHQQEQVWARHILVADEATAKSIRQQLVAGADFSTLAAQNSLDTGSKDKGGDLGWFGRGRMVAEFENAAFAISVGEISQPVQTTNGWHIIQVLGHEVRPLTASEYSTAVTGVFNQWLSDQRSSATIEVSKNWTANIPDQPSLDSAFADLYATATAFAKKPPQIPSITVTP
jgi:peptidyl-prolyl cis-trans isomerase D